MVLRSKIPGINPSLASFAQNIMIHESVLETKSVPLQQLNIFSVGFSGMSYAHVTFPHRVSSVWSLRAKGACHVSG